jgi:hypothetical protein
LDTSTQSNHGRRFAEGRERRVHHAAIALNGQKDHIGRQTQAHTEQVAMTAA